jgi:hypothetical protein
MIRIGDKNSPSQTLPYQIKPYLTTTYQIAAHPAMPHPTRFFSGFALPYQTLPNNTKAEHAILNPFLQRWRVDLVLVIFRFYSLSYLTSSDLTVPHRARQNQTRFFSGSAIPHLAQPCPTSSHQTQPNPSQRGFNSMPTQHSCHIFYCECFSESFSDPPTL